MGNCTTKSRTNNIQLDKSEMEDQRTTQLLDDALSEDTNFPLSPTDYIKKSGCENGSTQYKFRTYKFVSIANLYTSINIV